MLFTRLRVAGLVGDEDDDPLWFVNAYDRAKAEGGSGMVSADQFLRVVK